MPAVHDSRLKGNFGAAAVMARLSGECLVRPVTADTDVGVDLYCETVVGGSPFLHFWVQVKAGEQCKVGPERLTASCRFDRDHILYWMRQPVPVFAALVPTDWPIRKEPDIYIVDITSKVLLNAIPNTQASITLVSDYLWPAGDFSSITEFLARVVPDTTARLQCSKGIISASPTPMPQYVRTTPVVPVLRFKDVVRNQIRTTAAHAVRFSLACGEETLEDTEFRRLMTRVVAQFDDDPHWENFFARAISSHADERYEDAVGLYRRAKESIEDDPHVRGQAPWPIIVKIIEDMRTHALNRQQLDTSVFEAD